MPAGTFELKDIVIAQSQNVGTEMSAGLSLHNLIEFLYEYPCI